MIETVDENKYFTHKKNYADLVEFSKIVGAQVSLVTIQDGPLLELEELATALCIPSAEVPTYELVQIKIPKQRQNKSRQCLLDQANIIRRYIETQLTSGKTVSFKDLEIKFRHYSISKIALYKHFKDAKETVLKLGYQIEKPIKGSYRAIR